MNDSTLDVKQVASMVKQKPTLARRVSDMFKDGNMSGPPVLFRHGSMQRLRHCCQNLNLFPYLLYSFGNSKSHPVAKKIHLYIALLLRNFLAIIQGISDSFLKRSKACQKEQRVLKKSVDTVLDNKSGTVKLLKFGRQKRKRISLLLTVAVYLALLVLAFQMVGLFSLMIFGKFPPGFIFLISALLFLGCISLKVMAHDIEIHGIKEEKRKSE